LAHRRGDGGVQEQLGAFFKQPMTVVWGAEPEHTLHAQEQRLHAWLANGAATEHARAVGEAEAQA
jgi:myo-inositol-1-phosphate synthase